SLEQVLASMPPPATPTGNGIFTGRIVDPNGVPMPDVLVLVQPQPQQDVRFRSRAPDPPPDVDLEAEVRDFLRDRRAQLSDTYRVRTDADGRYRVEGLGGERYLVRPYASDTDFMVSRGQGWNAEPGTTIDFVGHRIMTIPVSVRLSNGDTPASVSLTSQSLDPKRPHGRSHQWDSKWPYLQLTPGPYRIKANLTDGSLLASGAMELEVRPDRQPEPIELEITVRPSVGLEVAFPTGFRPFPLRVHAFLAPVRDGREPSDAELLADGRKRNYRGRMDALRTFTDLQSGRYVVGLADGVPPRVVARTAVDVGDREAKVKLTWPTPRQAGHFLVQAVGPDGSVMRGLRWNAGLRTQTTLPSYPGRVYERDDGVVYIPHPKPPSGAAPGYVVQAQHPAQGVRRIHVDKLSTKPLRIEFEEVGRLRIQLSGYENTLYAGKLSVGTVLAGVAYPMGQRHPDPNGRVELGPLQPGSMRVSVRSLRPGLVNVELARVDVVVKSGRQNVDVKLPAFHDLTVRWLGGARPQFTLAPRKLEAGLEEPRFSQLTQRANTKGNARFKDLPPGQYELVVVVPRRPTVRHMISIPKQTDIDLPLRR
ncbi:MAG: hypothetical protein AAGD14_16280, partial [Planctomycetota bacterium]